MKKIVSLFLALTLIFSMSAALAEQTTGRDGSNECTVKVLNPFPSQPFAEWTFPSEIILEMSKNSADEWQASLATEYAVVFTDAAIKSGQELHIYMGGSGSDEVVVFRDAPLNNARLNIDHMRSFADEDNIDDLFANGDWKVPVTLGEYWVNSDWFDDNAGSSHIIHNERAEFEAISSVEFYVAFRG